MEWNIQWIKYLLGQSYIEEDFKLDNSNFGENAEKKANAQRLLSRFLSPSNFRAVINATSVNIVKPGAPATGAGQTGATTTTAPSTPIMHPSDTYAFKNKIENKSPEYLGQHSYFKRDPDTGLPTAGLAEEVSKIHLDGLTKKQNDILTLACKLAFTVVFSLQELEVCIHSGLRFLFFLRLVEMAKGMDEKAKTYAVISYHRWLIRSAYRDEQTGRVLRVDGENELLPNLKALIGFLGTASSTVVDPRVIYGIHHDLGWFYFGKFNWSEAYNHLLQYKALSKGIPDENLARLPSRFGTADDLIAVCMEMNKSQTPMDDDKPGQIMIKYSEKPEKLFSPEKLLTSIISRNPNPDCMVVDPNRQLQLKNRVEINTLIMKKQLFKATKLTIINSLESCFKEGRLNGFWCHEVDQSCISYVHRKKVSNPASHASDSEIDQLLETVDIWITNTIEKAGRYQEDKVRMCADTVTTYIFGYLFSEIFTSRRPDHYKKVKDCIVKCVKRDHSLSPGKAIGQLNDDYGALLQDYLRGIKYLELEDYIKALECFEFNKGHYDIVKYQNPDTEATYQSLTTQMRVYGLLTKVLIVGGNSNAAKVFIDEMKTIDSAVKNIEYLHMVRFAAECFKGKLLMNHTNTASIIMSLQEKEDGNTNTTQDKSKYSKLQDWEIYKLCVSLSTNITLISKESESLGIIYNHEAKRFVMSNSHSNYRPKIQAIPNIRSCVIKIIRALIMAQKDMDTATHYLRKYFGWCDDVILSKLFINILCGIMWNIVSSNGPYDAFGCIAYLPATHTLAPKISNEDLHPKLIENMKSQPYEEVPPKFNLKSVRDIALSLCLELYERHPGDESLYLCLFDIYTIKGSDLKIPSPFAGKKDNEAAVSMFLCYMAKVTNNFEYGAIDAALKKGWYRKRITVLIETLKRLNNFVAVAVLYQIELPINYQEAFSAIRSAAPMKQITKETSPFFWESSIVEYAQYQCFHTPGCKDIVLKAEKRIETPQGGRQKMLEKTMPNVSKFFKWLILQ